MPQTDTPPPDAAVEPVPSERPCEECGYDLRGLPPGRPCPECGHRRFAPPVAFPRPRPDLSWHQSVAAGLVLLLAVTLYGVSSVLVQPYTDDVAGTLPALNLPGPKLWVVPLLQRPIGRRPELPGMIGTRTALLALLAVWLVTARPSGGARGGGGGEIGGDTGPGEPVRLGARWASLVLFGMAFGAMVGSKGLWPAQLPPLRLVLVGAVELPAALLLYAHLHGLAGRVPGRDRRAVFALLRWMVPAVMAGGAALIATDWLRQDTPFFRHGGNRLALSAAYGVLAVTCGMIATAAVGSLALTYCGAAFPEAWRLASGSRRFARASYRWLSSAEGLRLRVGCVAAGLVLLVLAAVLGNDRILWFTARDGMVGNLPFYNFPGPKVFAAAAVPQLGQERYWDPIVSRAVLVALNLAAVWLLTVPLERRGGGVLRGVVRWSAVATVGAALGAAGAWRAQEAAYGFGDFRGAWVGSALQSERFAAVTVLCEVPVTILLYVYCARLAGAYAPGTGLRGRLLAVACAVPVLVPSALAMFLFFRRFRAGAGPWTLRGLGGAYGAVTLVLAVWAAGLLLTLAGTLVRRHVAAEPGRAKVRTVFRELPRPE